MIVNNDVAFGTGLSTVDFASPFDEEETDEMGRSLRARRKNRKRMRPTALARRRARREQIRSRIKTKPGFLGMSAAADIDDVDDWPDELDGRPGWVVPVAFGGGLLVLAGGALYLKKRGAK